jgi:lipopolysaccharide export system permease protein
MLTFGIFNWFLQEEILPATNRIQDELRTQIRSRGVTATKAGRKWIASGDRIFSFEVEAAEAAKVIPEKLKSISIFELDSASRLSAMTIAQEGSWKNEKLSLEGGVEKIVWHDGVAEKAASVNPGERDFADLANPFGQLERKPSHMNSSETRAYIARSDSVLERRTFAMALQKKYATLILPFVICLFTAPFALSLSRKGNVLTIAYAVALWLIFVAASNLFEQFGTSGSISPQLAVWSPIVLFALIGTILISRVKT